MFSPTGQLVRTIGREGSGPGEFRYPVRIWLSRDTLLVIDLDRASYFDTTGLFIRSEPAVAAVPRGQFEDGSLLFVVFAAGEAVFDLGYSRTRQAIVRGSLDRSLADTIAVVSGDEVYRLSVSGGGVASYPAPIGHARLVSIHGSSVFTGDGSVFEVRQLDQQGTLLRIMRRPGEAPPVSRSTVREFEQARLESAQTDRQRQRLNQLFFEWEYPATQPLYDQLFVDHGANVWVRHFAIMQEEAARWTVFDRSGRWLGELLLPSRLIIKDIGEDYVIGVWEDEMGVESVRIYSITK